MSKGIGSHEGKSTQTPVEYNSENDDDQLGAGEQLKARGKGFWKYECCGSIHFEFL